MVQNTIRTLAYGPYTATYIRWGKALDLHSQNRVVLMGHTLHEGKNQQARASFPFLFRSALIGPCSGSSFPAVQVSPSTAP